MSKLLCSPLIFMVVTSLSFFVTMPALAQDDFSGDTIIEQGEEYAADERTAYEEKMQQARQEQMIREAPAHLLGALFKVLIVMCSVALLGSILLPFFRSHPRSSGKRSNDPLALPAQLQRVRVWGKHHRLNIESGQALGEKSWTESKSYTAANVYSASQWTETTRHDRVWVRTPNRQDTSWALTNTDFNFLPGHFLSLVSNPRVGGYLIYNHNTDQLLTVPRTISQGNRSPFLLNALITTIVGVIGYFWASRTTLPEQVTANDELLDTVSSVLPCGIIYGVLPAIVVVWVVNRVVQNQRTSRFTKRWVPALHKYLKTRTTALRDVYSERDES